MTERATPWTLLLAVTAAGLAVWCLAAPSAGDLPGPALAGWAGSAVLLELMAARLGPLAVFSTAPAMVLAAASVSLPAAALTALLALSLRAALRDGPGPVGRLKESLMDLVPLLAGIGAAGLLGVWGGALAWLLLSIVVPGLLAADLPAEENVRWGRLRLLQGWPRLGTALLAPALAQLGWLAVLAVPVLGALQRSVGLSAQAPSRREQRQVLTSLDASQKAEEETRQALEAARREGRRKSVELATLERLTRLLGDEQTLEGTLKVVLDVAAQRVACDSMAVFTVQEGRLVPRAWRGGPRDRLEGALLLNLSEPVVERAWQSGGVVEGSGAGADRLFTQDAQQLALVLPEVGVLYLGRHQAREFDEDERHLLQILASHGSVVVKAVQRQLAEQEALRLHRAAHARLGRWVERLTSLLDGTRALASTLDPEVQMTLLADTLARVIPHQVGIVLTAERNRSWGGQVDSEAVRELTGVVKTNRVPLLVEDAAQTRFRPLVAGHRSLVAVPMLSEDAVVGAIILEAAPPGAFDREHQDMLLLVAYLAAVAYSSANRHQKLRESQAQLVQASKMAAVGQLAAGVAHELNTPLGGVILGIEGAEMVLRKKPERAESKLTQALAAANHARDIVAKLLVYCRAETTARRQLTLAEVAEDVLLLVRSQLAQDDLEVVVRAEPAPPVEGNPTELQQVVTNLIMNARDAVLMEGACSRDITLRIGTDGQGAPYLEVEDGGPGVPSEMAGRIFEPFFTTKPVGKGTGLGLSVSARLVEQHGGRLQLLEPTSGRGARFRLTLPG